MRIVVVDDEPVVSQTLGMILLHAGHRVSTFLNPEEALAAMLQEPPDMLITDMCMPKMDGMELAVAVAMDRPETHILLISGRRPLRVRDELVRVCSRLQVLYKPLHPQELINIIGRIGLAAA